MLKPVKFFKIREDLRSVRDKRSMAKVKLTIDKDMEAPHIDFRNSPKEEEKKICPTTDYVRQNDDYVRQNDNARFMKTSSPSARQTGTPIWQIKTSYPRLSAYYCLF